MTTTPNGNALTPKSLVFKPSNGDPASIRFVENGGKLWFSAFDICKALRFHPMGHDEDARPNTTTALQPLPEEDRANVKFAATRGRSHSVVSRDGLLNIVHRANTGRRRSEAHKVLAEEFLEWATHEVLPMDCAPHARANNIITRKEYMADLRSWVAENGGRGFSGNNAVRIMMAGQKAGEGEWTREQHEELRSILLPTAFADAA